MFKATVLLAVILATGIFFSTTSVSAQPDFDAFWTKFKAAVASRDKAAVANMTKFPLNMPYGVRDVRTRAEFLKRYDRIINMEADASRCFKVTKPDKDEKGYSVSCTFKENPESSPDRPIEYYFVKTKTGWKFAGMDNINE